jgi:tRNA (cmo5U34)-methyltransferase
MRSYELFFSAMIAEAFANARFTLFDLTPEMLTIARQRLKGFGKRVRFVTADFAKSAPSKPYDAVVSALAIHHLPDSGKRRLAVRENSARVWSFSALRRHPTPL